MSAPTTQPAPDVTPAPAAPVVVPNQYHLHGHGVSIAYYPDGFGPVQQNGRLRLSYRDASRTLSFYGDQVRVAQVPDIGTIVSVTIVPSVDTGPTDFSLVVPDVALALADSSAEIETFGVTTMHYVFVGAIGHPQHETYTVTTLCGTATARALPL
jgi:hypothetical protein